MTTVESATEAVVRAPAVPEVRRRHSVLFGIAAAWLGVIVVAAVFAPLLPIQEYEVPIGPPRAAPDGTLGGLLGTDGLGRSMLSRVVYGARVSLVVGVVAALSGFVVGSALGLLAGYLRGWVDSVLSYLADALLAFPPLILLLALASALQPSITTLLVALAVLVVPTFMRLARAGTLRWSSYDFVRAATNIGAGPMRVMCRELLPNLLPSVLAYLPVVIASLIVAEGSLSFLGLGIPPPMPSWGGLINDGTEYLATDPLVVLVPAAAIFLTVFALNVVGDRLRSAYQPGD